MDKPEGMTSHDVIKIARKALKLKNIGHTGVLDKPASGLLILLIGKATKLSRFLLELDKKYFANIVFGVRTTTDDSAGEIIEESSCDGLDKEGLLNILKSFQGSIKQTVPRYSSVQVDGVRLYKLAKKGIEISLPVREVTIYESKLLDFESDKKPRARTFFHCSKGTYIRSLARDIGEKAGCGAYLQKLRRTSIGWMSVDNSITVEKLQSISQDKIEENIVSMEEVVSGFPGLVLKEHNENTVRSGQKLKGEIFQNQVEGVRGKIIAILNSDKQLVAMVEPVEDFKWTDDYLPLKYLRVL